MSEEYQALQAEVDSLRAENAELKVALAHTSQISHVSDIRILTPASDTGESSDGNEDNGAEVIEGENFSAQILGDELILDLKSNATTGYTWVITVEPEQFASDYNVYVEPDDTKGMVGVSGITEFHIISFPDPSFTNIISLS